MLVRDALEAHKFGRMDERLDVVCIPYCYLQDITVRPVPCNYNVIQSVSALSRRRRGFKSRRGRQLNNLGEKCLLFCLTRRSEVSG